MTDDNLSLLQAGGVGVVALGLPGTVSSVVLWYRVYTLVRSKKRFQSGAPSTMFAECGVWQKAQTWSE